MAAPETSPIDTLDPYRLPTVATPIRYDVRLRPDLDAARFEGAVNIHLDIEHTTDVLVLNASELAIRRCTIDGVDASFALHEPTDRLVVTPPAALAAGTAVLAIEFTGILNDKLHGFYRSTYLDDAGERHVIAASQMQATDCRRAFPCWDEPEFKAVFGVTLDVEAGLTAISNGPEVERQEVDGRTVLRFADTMKMSSYLVAFIVGRLETTTPIDVNGTPLRVVHAPGKGHLTDFALEVGEFALRWFEEYYGIAYPSDKVDLVALPDFAAGAMENLGCITFRENLLLVDPATSTQAERESVADVVAHELAHMWFGDLVTMRWWNGIWLNEAFATFMEIAACDAFRADWERWTSFGLERTLAFETDSLASTRPVEFEVRSPADCEGMFDVLTYQKGGALLRMLEQYLGADRFRAGVSHYLHTHAYANTETNDLWDAIEATSLEPVRRIMDSWIWQPGFPLVTATLVDTERGPCLQLAQERFTFTGGDDGSASDGPIWAMPIHIRNGGVTSTLLLDSRQLGEPLALMDPAGPVIVNAGGHGFIRVAYSDELRTRLRGDALRSMTTLERYNLVDDAWSATLAGRLSAAALLEFLDGFGDERDYAVWQAIVIALRGLGRIVDDRDNEPFQQRVVSLVLPVLMALGEPSADDTDLTSKLRGLLVGAAGVLGGDVATQARCREWYRAAQRDPAGGDAELIAAATSVVAATGDIDTYEQMLERFHNGSTPQEQLRHLYALTEFDDADLILRTCEFAMTDEVKTQNAPFVLRQALANRHHGALAWAFVRDHWLQANERFPSNTIVRMVDGVKLINDPAIVDEVQQFFADHEIKQAASTLAQILERQRVNAALRTRESARLGAALQTPGR